MKQVTTAIRKTGQAVARPLKVLVPLIKEDLRQGDEAAERAALPYYRAAGEKLNEAKAQLPAGAFMSWVSRNFNRSQRQANRYMSLARTTTDIQIGLRSPGGLGGAIGQPPRWTPQTARYPEPVKESIEQAKRQAERIESENLSRAQERAAENALCMRIIDIGYKVLAKELHPDKGGSREAMARLSRCRDRLRAEAR